MVKVMNEGRLISVIVPCYNYGKYLPNVFQCLLKQTYLNWECLVIDDGSVDNTAKITFEYIDRDPRIKYYYQPNSGLAAARNRGIKESSGFFIQFLDSDDIILPDKFEKEISIFESSSNVDVVYSDFIFNSIETNDKYRFSNLSSNLGTNPLLSFLLYWENGLIIPIHSFLYKASCFKRVGTFDEALPTHEDMDMHIRILKEKIKFSYHEDQYAIYNKHELSMASDMTNMYSGIFLVWLKSIKNKEFSLLYKLIIIWRYACCFESVIELYIRQKEINIKKIIKNYFLINFILLFSSLLLLLPVIFYRVYRILFFPNKRIYIALH